MRATSLPCLLSFCLAAAAPLAAETVLPSPYWRHTISLPEDPFRAQGFGEQDLGWIKFTLFKSDLTKVYFQDSNHFPFHYDFAHALVKEYQGFTRQQFDQSTLDPATQIAVLGAVILPHWVEGLTQAPINEYGIQLVAAKPYDPAFVVTLFDLVRSRVSAPGGTQAFYFPSFEQQASAEQNRAFFESHGIFISSTDRWSTQNAIYAPGWALGAIKFFTAAEITPAYRSGQLVNSDILLTDGVPAEVPLVAGIVSLVPSTPNSHVAILSNTFGIPFVHLSIQADADRAMQLVGNRIVLRASSSFFGNDVRLLDAEHLSQQQYDELLALKMPPPLDISPVTPYGAYSASAQNLNPSDIRFFGGKAANFGMIRRSIPNNSPVAAAFSFDLWTAFRSQVMQDGRTLRETIHSILAGHTYPPDMAALSADLQVVRELVEDDTAFSPALQAAIIATLQDPQYGFDPDRNIRFRSSTNVEDLGEFSGAGMYDSFSGCLADDLDANAAGPSICDPTEDRERGVFRAIRKVYASFYNQNAFLERLRRSVDEGQVGMGLLVHHSYPDEFELANGVATYQKRSTFSNSATLITQKGAVSVTNPPPGSIPEQVDAFISGGNVYPSVVTHSNLVPLGGTVLEWDAEYRQLVNLIRAVAAAFEAVTGKTQYVLDFEYKKLAPTGRLEVKQVRELALPDTTRDTAPFLLAEPMNYCTFQGEFGDVFSNHRLKLRWAMRPRNAWLIPQELASCILAGDSLEYLDENAPRTLPGAPPAWPEFSHSYADNVTTDTWRLVGAENPTRLSLVVNDIGTLVSDAQVPVLTLSDLGFGRLELHAAYGKPVPIVEEFGGPPTTIAEVALLEPCRRPATDDIRQERTIEARGISIATRFYWPNDPPAAAGYTAPLVRWDQTTLTGLTAEPIVLKGYYSQTYRPGHHNFTEYFLFEPRLEPGLPEGQRAELRAKNIRLIYAFLGFQDPIIEVYGLAAPGDFNHDHRVDAGDLQHFAACAAGPSIPQPDVHCADTDLDDDGDTDHADFGLFQRCYSGSAVAEPTCLD